MSWNWLGIFIWVIILLYLLFIIKNIRKRHLIMIIKNHKRFETKTIMLDFVEIAAFLVASIWMISNMFFDNPTLNDHDTMQETIEYRPLILTPSNKNSYYVSIKTSKQKSPVQTYTVFYAGNKLAVNNNIASISYGTEPLNVVAEKIPYSEKELKKEDVKYQKAYLATYTARYKNVWQNGIGLHANQIATKYYLIRIPDRTFIKQN